MRFKLRLKIRKDGQCYIQKKHWLGTLGFWWTITNDHDGHYMVVSEQKGKTLIQEYYKELDNKITVGYKEYE